MRFWTIFAAFNGFTAVLMGALGAHALAAHLPPGGAEWLATAERYQIAHALALGLVAALSARVSAGAAGRWLAVAGACFSVGMILFSGSLYALALSGWRPVAMLAPVGGLALMAGWLALGCFGATMRRAA
jgi:uncharacterized membrane protein YgdD (TMEM256/DUF423 family)